MRYLKTHLARWFAVVAAVILVVIFVVAGYFAVYNWVDARGYIISGVANPRCSTRECLVSATTLAIMLAPFAVIGAFILVAGFIYLIYIDTRHAMTTDGFTSSGIFIAGVLVTILVVPVATMLGAAYILAPTGETFGERVNSGIFRGFAAIVGVITVIIGAGVLATTFQNALRDTRTQLLCEQLKKGE
jgi:hypothetical protein